jgi:ATP adenylyltransferase
VEHLWSPWRLAYVTGATPANLDSSGCIFCRADDPDESLVVFRGQSAYVVLNLYPYNNGHLMVVPYRHVANLQSTTASERDEIMRLTRHAEMALMEAYNPQGLNIGINLGRPAGAGVLDHLHVHLVPRWNGDTNFMSVFAETRVLPETLSDTRRRLEPIFTRLARENS